MNALTPNEVLVIQMALQTMIEDLESVSGNPKYPFTPEARLEQKQILETSRSALQKIVVASGHLVKLDPYQEGTENEFLTKQS